MRAFRLAYDGSGYRGFQRQPHGETVEDELFAALRELGVGFDGGSPAGYAAAGRTDAGVSARAQTVAFEAPAWLTPRALDGELPGAIRAWASADVEPGFHATHDATERVYKYFLHAPAAETGAREDVTAVDDGRAREACRRLSAEADFHNFTPDDEGTERAVSVSTRRDGPFLILECRAGGFARQLVRRLVSVVEAVARGVRDPSFITRALGPEPLSGPDGIAPAAPAPLVLFGVSYPGVDFDIDPDALESARGVFRARRRERLAAARVAGSLVPDDP
ncbi:tRNA pseudouridine synthase TruA [Natronomonas moolapensis 8.8.11]|uniref:tRNA pseudouridine synthase n=1 Tax=Natronomonas moolapensis (strain DSM 18674 / CECT 7526 / JCM 14361 / 8.8.11) TaxID=268739 RepID=M1XK75_NATM8|nr:tRNA pseudouridine(38-40) synthase TruA [Natronomonas moolapensis]CCQ35392.1 tRNA pseudouridine synthase TruA [Natronomonas moolapensis 8.8.11]